MSQHQGEAPRTNRGDSEEFFLSMGWNGTSCQGDWPLGSGSWVNAAKRRRRDLVSGGGKRHETWKKVRDAYLHLMTKPRIVRVQMNAKLSGEASGMLIPEFLGDCLGVVGWVVVKTWQDGDQEAHTRFAVGSGTQVALQYFSWPLSQATQILRINHFGNPMLHPKGEVFPPSGLGHSHFDGASL